MAKQQKQEDGAPSRLSQASRRRILCGVGLLAAFLATALLLWRVLVKSERTHFQAAAANSISLGVW